MAGSETRNHVLFGLPPTTIEYEYQGRKHLLEMVEEIMETCTRETHIIFSKLDPQTYERDIENTNNWQINKSFDTYLPKVGLLLLEMPTSEVHEATSRGFLLTMWDAIPRRLHRTLAQRGTAEYSSTTRRKAADEAFLPITLPPGRSNHWPTMVVECGWSETRAKLERDCRWWLHDSDGDVKIALSISVHTTRKEIIIRKWERFQFQGRRGKGKPWTGERVEQTIIMTQTRNHPIRVTAAPLVLEFEKLFLRQPVASRREHDIKITAEKLRGLAEGIWQAHPNV